MTGPLTDADFLGRDDSSIHEAALQPLVDWTTQDVHAIETSFDELEAWVDWLIADYGLTPNIVPECWAGHGPLLWELSALHHDWMHTYRLPNQDKLATGAAVQWQAHFSAARARLIEWVARAGCRPGEHHD